MHSYLQEAEVVGVVVPEPFDVRTEHAVDAAALVFDNPATHGFDSSTESRSSGRPLDCCRICCVYGSHWIVPGAKMIHNLAHLPTRWQWSQCSV